MLLSFRPFVRLVPLFALCLGALILFGPAAPRCAAATIYYVALKGSDTNPGTLAAPFLTIQHGINTAVSGDTVTIEDGTYTGPGNVDLDFGGRNITVTSQHGAAATIIDCGGYSSSDGSGNHRGFILDSVRDIGETDVTISGLTIENGYESNASGGAIDNYGVNLTVQNCIIKNNVVFNPGSGGGINSGSGLSSTLTVTNCTIVGNTAYNSGGGGIYSYNYTGTKSFVTNCTLENNSSDLSHGGGGGIFCGDTGTMTLTNDILFNDTNGEVVGANAIVTFCDTQGGYTGIGNIDADPLFVNSLTDLHLQSGSPCLGVGTASGAPTTTIDGYLRPNPPSIGAYELTSLPAPPTDLAVAYQINNSHTGSVTTPNLTPPLVRRWTVDLGADVSYPLIAQGKVYVTVGDSRSGQGVVVEALSQATGQVAWGPFSVRGNYWWANACYDNGTVFVVNDNGVLYALNADTGALLWQEQLPGQYAFDSPPTAAHGIVYTGGAGSGGTLYAVRESDGVVLWRSSVENGNTSSPVVTDDGVYVSYAGPQTYKFDPTSGSLLWHYSSGIEGGGGDTPVLYNGRLYVRDNNLILDSATGIPTTFTGGAYNTSVAPAFDYGNILQVYQGSVSVQQLSDPSHSYSEGFAGDSAVTAPIAVNGLMYAGYGSGTIRALDETTGNQIWNDTLPSPILDPNEYDYTRPWSGLAAGQSLLVVPAGHLLAAYGNPAPAAPTGLQAVAGNAQVTLTWTAPTGPVTSYTLYRGTSATSLTALKSGITATTFTNVSLKNGTTYYYAVAAVNSAGTGPKSSVASATPMGVAAAPTNLKAAAGNTTVTLSWTAPPGTVTSYTLYRGTSATSLAVLKTGITATTFTNVSLKNGTTYYYAVAAVNTAGTGAKSSTVTATPLAPPAAPTNLQAVAGNAQVTLTWTAPAGPVTSYTLYRGTSATSLTALKTGITATTFTNVSLKHGTTYYYTVSAVNAGGTGPDSNEVSATP